MQLINKIKAIFNKNKKEEDNSKYNDDMLAYMSALLNFKTKQQNDVVSIYTKRHQNYVDETTALNSFNPISNIQTTIASSAVQPFSQDYLKSFGQSFVRFLNFLNKSTDNDVLFYRLQDIDIMIKSNAIIKNIAFIPISDALDGLKIVAKDDTDQESIDKINKMIDLHFNEIVDACFDANIHGGCYLMLFGDSNNIAENIGTIAKKGDYKQLYYNKYDIRAVDASLQDVVFFKAKFNQSYEGTIRVNGTAINKNRLVLFTGTEEAPYFFKNRCNGYSLSVYDGMKDLLSSISQELISYDEIMKKQGMDVVISAQADDKDNKRETEIIRNLREEQTEKALQQSQDGNLIMLPGGFQYNRLMTNIDYHGIMVGLAERINLYTRIPANKFLSAIGVGGLSGTDVNNNERDYQRVLNGIQRHFYKSLYSLIDKSIQMVFGTTIDFDIVFEPNIEVTEQQRVANQQATATVLATLDGLSQYKPDNQTIKETMTKCGFFDNANDDEDKDIFDKNEQENDEELPQE